MLNVMRSASIVEQNLMLYQVRATNIDQDRDLFSSFYATAGTYLRYSIRYYHRESLTLRVILCPNFRILQPRPFLIPCAPIIIFSILLLKED